MGAAVGLTDRVDMKVEHYQEDAELTAWQAVTYVVDFDAVRACVDPETHMIYWGDILSYIRKYQSQMIVHENGKPPEDFIINELGRQIGQGLAENALGLR